MAPVSMRILTMKLKNAIHRSVGRKRRKAWRNSDKGGAISMDVDTIAISP